jgi:hypothetical protein
MHRIIKRTITVVTTNIRKFSWYEPADSPKAPAAPVDGHSRIKEESSPKRNRPIKKTDQH